MKKKQIVEKLAAVLLAAGMAVSAAACGSSGSSGDAGRKDAQQIKEENQISSGVSQADSGGKAAETSSGCSGQAFL